MSHKIFENNLVVIRKSKHTLKLKKLAYIGMCIPDLCKVKMQESHCDYIKNKCDNKSILLFNDIDSLMHEIKTEDVCDFSSSKEMFHFSNYSTKSEYYDVSNKLVIKK